MEKDKLVEIQVLLDGIDYCLEDIRKIVSDINLKREEIEDIINNNKEEDF